MKKPHPRLVPPKADFLWPFEDGSIDEAGYEFANASTERYRKIWWRILLSRMVRPHQAAPVKKSKP